MHLQVRRIFITTCTSRRLELAERIAERSFLAGGISGVDFLLLIRGNGAVFSSRAPDGSGFSLRGPVGRDRMPGQPDSRAAGIDRDDDHYAQDNTDLDDGGASDE